MWSPFSFDGLDVDDSQLPNITTDMGFDEGIVKADDKADDDGDLDLFRSYQLTKECAKCNDNDPSCKEDSMPDPDEDDDFEESAFAEMENIMAEADEDDDFDDEVEECGDNYDDDVEESASPFTEMDNIFNGEDSIDVSDEVKECGDNYDDEIDECDDLDKSENLEEGSYADIAEAVLEDEEDDLIADSLDDMPDDDDPEIDANVDGVDEIEQDIMDDEEDDLIDIAMDADSDEDVNYGDED